jgi:hypothetical protein
MKRVAVRHGPFSLAGSAANPIANGHSRQFRALSARAGQKGYEFAIACNLRFSIEASHKTMACPIWRGEWRLGIGRLGFPLPSLWPLSCLSDFSNRLHSRRFP